MIFSNIIRWQGNGNIHFGEEKIIFETNRINKALRVANKVYNDNINYRGHEILNGKTVTVEKNGEMLCSFGYRVVIRRLNEEEKNLLKVYQEKIIDFEEAENKK